MLRAFIKTTSQDIRMSDFLQNSMKRFYSSTHFHISINQMLHESDPALKNSTQFLQSTNTTLVFDNCLLGKSKVAKESSFLRENSITHVLNASETLEDAKDNKNFYAKKLIKYYGCNVDELSECNLNENIKPAAHFIHEAINESKASKGNLYVHCYDGMNRSATLVTAYLMLFKDFKLVNALQFISQKRLIIPNEQLIKNLEQLEFEIEKKKISYV